MGSSPGSGSLKLGEFETCIVQLARCTHGRKRCVNLPLAYRVPGAQGGRESLQDIQ